MKLNYKKYGSEEKTLIILHGLFGSLDNWQTLGKRFGEHFTTYIVDQRNHGKSPHLDSHNYQEMANDLNELIDESKKPHLGYDSSIEKNAYIDFYTDKII